MASLAGMSPVQPIIGRGRCGSRGSRGPRGGFQPWVPLPPCSSCPGSSAAVCLSAPLSLAPLFPSVTACATLCWAPWVLSARLLSPRAPRGPGQVFPVLSSPCCGETPDLGPGLRDVLKQLAEPRRAFAQVRRAAFRVDVLGWVQVATLLGAENICNCAYLMHFLGGCRCGSDFIRASWG